MDEQRLKARQAKAGLNPGPGAYDVKRAIVTASEVRQPNFLRFGGALMSAPKGRKRVGGSDVQSLRAPAGLCR